MHPMQRKLKALIEEGIQDMKAGRVKIAKSFSKIFQIKINEQINMYYAVFLYVPFTRALTI